MRTLILATALLGLPSWAQAGPLNDTGIDFCRDHATHTDTPVSSARTCTPAEGGQDGRYGRDAAASKGVLTKVGGGGKGFDFSKIGNNGSVLPATALLGAGPGDWACTYDNNTGLMWEVKTAGGLRSQDHTYTWYDSVHNYDGNPGAESGGVCETPDRCDTEKFAADVNAVGLCGHADWRLPTLHELANLVDYGRATYPTIDPDYFPNTPSSDFWSATPHADTTAYAAWTVDFLVGYSGWPQWGAANPVRLVRSGP